jgi:uncharacterized membrane protein
LGGFFDGVLLHQVLQWHHLLSAFEGRDARFQVAADGYFHVLMYVIALVGLWLLWRAQRRQALSGRALLSGLLLGFGMWNVVDVVGFHWLAGIHRIRMDGPDPLFWDLLWLGVFGGVPLALAWLVRRTRGGGPGVPRGAAAMVALLVVGLGGWALRPSQSGFVTVLFAPHVTPQEALAAVAASGGRIAWTDGSGQVLVLDEASVRQPHRLYARGAILVSGSGVPKGCFDAARL